MRSFTFLLLALLAFLCFAGCGEKKEDVQPSETADTTAANLNEVGTEDDSAAHLAVCRTAVDKLGAALKKALTDAMAERGPVGALEVCKVEAVPIAKTISIEEGLIVGRVSLRPRNPANAPDDWERARLAEFEGRKTAGETPATLDAWAIVGDQEGHRTFRYMKAIPTVGMCLGCHGSDLKPDVAAKVKELYPQDLAVGYAPGDLRGAFTVSMPLD